MCVWLSGMVVLGKLCVVCNRRVFPWEGRDARDSAAWFGLEQERPIRYTTHCVGAGGIFCLQFAVLCVFALNKISSLFVG